jgi:hypothetical protein
MRRLVAKTLIGAVAMSAAVVLIDAAVLRPLAEAEVADRVATQLGLEHPPEVSVDSAALLSGLAGAADHEVTVASVVLDEAAMTSILADYGYPGTTVALEPGRVSATGEWTFDGVPVAGTATGTLQVSPEGIRFVPLTAQRPTDPAPRALSAEQQAAHTVLVPVPQVDGFAIAAVQVGDGEVVIDVTFAAPAT